MQGILQAKAKSDQEAKRKPVANRDSATPAEPQLKRIRIRGKTSVACSGRHTPAAPKPPMKAKAAQKPPMKAKAADDAPVPWATWIKRMHSRAYYNETEAAKRDGCALMEVKIRARAKAMAEQARLWKLRSEGGLPAHVLV